MKTVQFTVERISFVSSKPFEDVISAVDAMVGRPDMIAFGKKIASAETFADIESLVRNSVGPFGLMEFARFNLGQVIGKDRAGKAPQCLRLVIGNPVIMKQLAEHVPDAGSYAPVTILVDERPDGVHLSYDRMASLLAPYGNSTALAVALGLDSKVEKLLTLAAG